MLCNLTRNTQVYQRKIKTVRSVLQDYTQFSGIGRKQVSSCLSAPKLRIDGAKLGRR